jgi:hypothetical protein
VTRLEPLELAGGHSFETDLVEVAGGESITHGGEEVRIAPGLTDLQTAGPDLVIVATARALSRSERAQASALLSRWPVAFATVDPDALWLGDPRASIETWVDLIDSAREPLRSVRPEAGP